MLVLTVARADMLADAITDEALPLGDWSSEPAFAVVVPYMSDVEVAAVMLWSASFLVEITTINRTMTIAARMPMIQVCLFEVFIQNKISR